jgi:hypothetical protein
MLVITAAGDERGRALWKMPLRAGTIGELAPFAAKPAGRSAAPPTAVTVGVRGFVVLAYSATDDQPQSELAFYNPINGNRVLQMTCELPNIVALAYSPHSGNLYAASSQADDLTSAISVEPSSENSTGGVYRLDDASQPGARACATTKVADVRNLTAMTFAPDGALYITTKGNDKETSESGALLRITGDL